MPGGSVVTLASGASYEPFGPLSGLTYGNGLVLTRTFTQDYLISGVNVQDPVSSALVLNRSYAYGDQVNITGITDNMISARSESYAYTPSNRLQQGNGIWGSVSWTYDAVGNRTAETLTSGSSTTSTYGYPTGSNRLSSLSQSGSAVRTFTYDGAGNVTSDNRTGTAYNYVYNNHGRLAELDIGSTVTADYTYDGLERMAIRTTQNMTPAGTTHYVYDLAGHLISEATGTGTIVTEYVWLDDMPLAVEANLDTSSPNLYYVHADHLNRPLKMTDGTETIVWDAVYTPFGTAYSITGSAANNLRFPGQYFLIEDGLHYNWYRHYDPTIGRYLQADLLSFIDGPSIYAYAGSSAILSFDVRGLAIGDYPPAPPGYDPQTWRYLGRNNQGWPMLQDPTGRRWICHAEDKGHWRHWDVNDDDDEDRWPSNSVKPWPNQKAAPYGDQSATDPSGNQPPWVPPITDSDEMSPFGPAIVPHPAPGARAPYTPIPRFVTPEFGFPF